MSSFIFNITFDCADPERLAAFWSQVTGHERLALNSDDLDDDVVALGSSDRRGVRRLLFFKVPEPKTVKNRVHIDLASNDPVAEIERLIALGAIRVEHLERNGRGWTVMLDPEGNEFCVG